MLAPGGAAVDSVLAAQDSRSWRLIRLRQTGPAVLEEEEGNEEGKEKRSFDVCDKERLVSWEGWWGGAAACAMNLSAGSCWKAAQGQGH